MNVDPKIFLIWEKTTDTFLLRYFLFTLQTRTFFYSILYPTIVLNIDNYMFVIKKNSVQMLYFESFFVWTAHVSCVLD